MGSIEEAKEDTFSTQPSTLTAVFLICCAHLDRSEDTHLLVVGRNWSEPEQHMNTSAGSYLPGEELELRKN
ncbi:hypothetical protein INR49_026150 [Caranx melampygus]|nr:hypothetical protein INR49_026150 [Caranx melampygus]